MAHHPALPRGEDGVLAVDVELFPTAYPFAVASRGQRCRTEVLHDADHPSRLELPVLPPS